MSQLSCTQRSFRDCLATCSIGLHGPGIRSMLMTRAVTMAQRPGISCMSVELVAAIDRWLLLGRYRPKSDIEQPLTEGVN